MLALTLAVSLQLGAAEIRPEAWVVVTRRSGVAKPQALELARTLGSALNERGVPTPTPVDDATNCAAKVPCLVDLAQKKGVAVLVAVEAGSALDDVVLHVEALSVEEFGKKLATFDFTGPANDFKTGLKEKVEEFFAPAVRNVLGLGQPVAEAKKPPPPEKKPEPVPEQPPPSPEEKKPEPAPVAVTDTAPAPESSGTSPLKIVGIAGMGAGAVLLITSGILGTQVMSKTSQRRQLCPDGMQCADPMAYDLYTSAGSLQNTAVVLMATGLVLAAAGAVLFFLDLGGGSDRVDPGGPGENPGLSLAPSVSPDGAGMTLLGRF